MSSPASTGVARASTTMTPSSPTITPELGSPSVVYAYAPSPSSAKVTFFSSRSPCDANALDDIDLLLTRPIVARHGLVDGPEDRSAVGIEHLDSHPVAEAQKRGARRARVDRLEHPLLGEARYADRAVAVRHRTRADDGAGGERARPGRVRDELGKAERHVDAGIGPAEGRAVHRATQRQMNARAVPCLAQLRRRYRDRGERGRRLA